MSARKVGRRWRQKKKRGSDIWKACVAVTLEEDSLPRKQNERLLTGVSARREAIKASVSARLFVFPLLWHCVGLKRSSICHIDSAGVLLNAFCDSEDCTYSEVSFFLLPVLMKTAFFCSVLQHVFDAAPPANISHSCVLFPQLLFVHHHQTTSTVLMLFLVGFLFIFFSMKQN